MTEIDDLQDSHSFFVGGELLEIVVLLHLTFYFEISTMVLVTHLRKYMISSCVA